MQKLFARIFIALMLTTLIVPTVTTPRAKAMFIWVTPIVDYETNKQNGTPTSNHSVQKGRSLPVKDKAYSSKDLYKDNKLVQRRYYDKNGKADEDIDYTNRGNPKQHPKVPHRHKWSWPPAGPPSRGGGE
jgi:hypothetical protein